MADIATFRPSDRVDAAIAARRMLDHPFYQAWNEGRLSLEDLKEYAKQYFHHVDVFPKAVSQVHANCPDRAGRKMLAENIAEEEGLEAGRDDHATLWKHFAYGMGASEDEVETAKLNPETQGLIDTFREQSRKSYAAGLGALYAYESQLPEVAATKIDGLVNLYEKDDADTLRFFRVHEEADVEHADVCRGLINKLDADEQLEAEAGAAALCDALNGFLSGMQRTRGIQ